MRFLRPIRSHFDSADSTDQRSFGATFVHRQNNHSLYFAADDPSQRNGAAE
jgi:hypothetical protein